jgi:xanthine dehydrogenase YagR molybdenum-binding subunit
MTPLGTKGVGELAITGMTAAIANAVCHATGTRIRSLPISIEKVLGPESAALGSDRAVPLISMRG